MERVLFNELCYPHIAGIVIWVIWFVGARVLTLDDLFEVIADEVCFLWRFSLRVLWW